jgi:hypothetical protein
MPGRQFGQNNKDEKLKTLLGAVVEQAGNDEDGAEQGERE